MRDERPQEPSSKRGVGAKEMCGTAIVTDTPTNRQGYCRSICAVGCLLITDWLGAAAIRPRIAGEKSDFGVLCVDWVGSPPVVRVEGEAGRPESAIESRLGPEVEQTDATA